jgi:DNA polymerase
MFEVNSYAQWRSTARTLLRTGVPPHEIVWSATDNAQCDLFDSTPRIDSPTEHKIRVPSAFFKLAESVSRHRNERRWDLLYRLAWRLTHGEHHLLEIEIDDLVATLNAMRRAVEKDAYRMRQFVRFRKTKDERGEQFVAWYEPEHHTLGANGKFFIDRFGAMRWAILTPEASLIWNLEELQMGPGVTRNQAPREDEMEDLWRLYYRTIYNPARLNLTAMRAQLPVNRWNNLPEAGVIPDLVRLSRGRLQEMANAQPRSALEWIPKTSKLSELRDAVRQCRACNLCERATQPVWGEGAPHAELVMVGEQPGNEEDLAGRPFVGPAGAVLNEAMLDAGIERAESYVTNAVKAFKFEERGKRRIHQTPRASEIGACRPWLMAELRVVQPKLIVCLGSSAAHAVLGRKVQVSAERGRVLHHANAQVLITFHPSAILRVPDGHSKRELKSALVSDLIAVKRLKIASQA